MVGVAATRVRIYLPARARGGIRDLLGEDGMKRKKNCLYAGESDRHRTEPILEVVIFPFQSECAR